MPPNSEAFQDVPCSCLWLQSCNRYHMPVEFEAKSPYSSRRSGTWIHNKAKSGASFHTSQWTAAKTGRVHLVSEILALMLYLSGPVFAQQESGSSATRSGQIQEER